MYLSKIKELKITAALLIKKSQSFAIIRNLCRNSNPTISEEFTFFYSKLKTDLFWFINHEHKQFWNSFMSLKDKILSYFDNFPSDYARMIEIPEEFIPFNAGSPIIASVKSETYSIEEYEGDQQFLEVEAKGEEVAEEDNIVIEEEENSDSYDVIPLITPDGKVVRVVVKFEAGDSRDSNEEKTRKLVDAIETGELNYRSLPKEQVILYENEEENRKAMIFLKVERQSKEERKFTESAFKIKSCFSVKCENIDFKAVFNCFEDLKLIKYSAVLLLKHSNCILIIKNIRDFDVKKSKKSKSLESKLSQIRLESKKLYIYYKSFFPFLPSLKNFWKEYVDCKSRFDEVLSTMSKDERVCVTEIPSQLLDTYA